MVIPCLGVSASFQHGPEFIHNKSHALRDQGFRSAIGTEVTIVCGESTPFSLNLR
jgi:hypothetical protein